MLGGKSRWPEFKSCEKVKPPAMNLNQASVGRFRAGGFPSSCVDDDRLSRRVHSSSWLGIHFANRLAQGSLRLLPTVEVPNIEVLAGNRNHDFVWENNSVLLLSGAAMRLKGRIFSLMNFGNSGAPGEV